MVADRTKIKHYIGRYMSGYIANGNN